DRGERGGEGAGERHRHGDAPGAAPARPGRADALLDAAHECARRLRTRRPELPPEAVPPEEPGHSSTSRRVGIEAFDPSTGGEGRTLTGSGGLERPGRARAFGAGRLEVLAEAPERPVERDLDRVRAQLEQLSDLARGEVGAVAERDELAVALVEPRHRLAELKPAERALLVPLARALRRLVDRRLPAERGVGDAAADDADEPGGRIAAARVEARAVAERTLEGLARDVLGVRPVADPVGDVRVDARDQRPRVGERVASHGLPPSTAIAPSAASSRSSSAISGLRGSSRLARASAAVRAGPLEARARSNQRLQSPGSLRRAVRKLARAAAVSPRASCASPSCRQGAIDQGSQLAARRASRTADAQRPSRAASLARASSMWPTRKTKPAAAIASAPARA